MTVRFIKGSRPLKLKPTLILPQPLPGQAASGDPSTGAAYASMLTSQAAVAQSIADDASTNAIVQAAAQDLANQLNSIAAQVALLI